MAGKLKSRNYRTYTKPVSIAEDAKFRLAIGLIAGILFLMVLAGFAEVFGSQVGDNVFNKSIIILPPMVTLIIGYYFSHRKP